MQFLRTMQGSRFPETLTIIRLPEDVFCEHLERALPFGVRVECDGDEQLFSLDGDVLTPRFSPVTVPGDDEIPPEVAGAILKVWTTPIMKVEVLP